MANLLCTTPERVMVAAALANLDACALGGWREWEAYLHGAVDLYAEKRKASDAPKGERLEDTAPDRMHRIALNASAQKVHHV